MSGRSVTQNRLSEYGTKVVNPRPSALMNNFAGPSDESNF